MMENKKMRAEHPKKELAVDILYDIIGSILFAAGIYTFAEGGNFAAWRNFRYCIDYEQVMESSGRYRR